MKTTLIGEIIGMSVKGDWPRKNQTTREERNLRWKYANGGMTFKQFEAKYKKLLKAGKIVRSGRVCDE